MAQSSRTFRVFVSSTFSDLKAERNALQERVFPRLRNLAASHACRFQAIDLRWGVSEEASLDQQAMNICLGEIARCQQTSPRPNFIVLLGDRYGWCPPPSQIPQDEFEKIRGVVMGEEESLLKEWYFRDENAVPGEWRLKPRQRGGHYERPEDWQPVEARLHAILAGAVEKLNFTPAQCLPYTTSATEQEISRGALLVKEAPEHVFCFFRSIEGLPQRFSAVEFQALVRTRLEQEYPGGLSPSGQALVKAILELSPATSARDFACHLQQASKQTPKGTPEKEVLDVLRQVLVDFTARDFLNLDEAEWTADEGAHTMQEKLKERLQKYVPQNVKSYPARWTGDGISTGHIDRMCEDVYNSLAGIIQAEMEHPHEIVSAEEVVIHIRPEEALDAEGLAHWKFAQERLRFFVGRTDMLAKIAGYLREGGGRSLAIVGGGGTGKSALVAKALQEIQTAHPEAQMVYRFIGATPASSDGRSLLDSLCHEISRRYGADEADIPTDYRDLVPELRKRMGLASADRPLIVFLDSLDQLSTSQDARSLVWLPNELPEGVRVIASTRLGEKRDSREDKPVDSMASKHLEDILKALHAKQAHVEELGGLSRQEGDDLLAQWLASVHRTLQGSQRAEVLDKFIQSGGNPLYLKLAFEEARLWTSDLSQPQEQLAMEVKGIIKQNMVDRLAKEGNHGQMLVSHALGYLATSRYGLAEDELLDLLSRDLQVYEWFFKKSYHLPADLMQWAIKYRRTSKGDAIPRGDEERAALAWLKDVRTPPEQVAGFLKDVLPKTDGPRLPVVLWSRLSFDLEPYLTERTVDGSPLLTFYHRELGEVSKEVFLANGNDRPYHEKLAAYFTSKPLYLDEKETTPNLRKLSEMPYNLIRGRMYKEVEQTLSDFEFIRAKFAAEKVLDLFNNYDDALVFSDSTWLGRMRIDEFRYLVQNQSHCFSTSPALVRFSPASRSAEKGESGETQEFVVYISSTFSDWKVERDALRQRVFPRLRELCRYHGFRFRVMDMSWGVSEAASLEQQTMRIVQNEIKHCQEKGPFFFFITLLGDRYGWRPLPSEIPADEFEQIYQVTDPKCEELLGEWYRRDDNVVPPVYVLQPRGARYLDYSAWAPVEYALRKYLEHAASIINLDELSRAKYQASSTEQEIVQGAFTRRESSDHVFIFMRDINNLSLTDNMARDFAEMDGRGEFDQEARFKLLDLKKRLLVQFPRNTFRYETFWTGTNISLDHIDSFCEQVWHEVASAIKTGIEMELSSPDDREIRDHVSRGHIFIGRVEEMHHIAEYLSNNEGVPLVISGEKGSGKSALIAEIVRRLKSSHPHAQIIPHYVGELGDISSMGGWLECLNREIPRLNGTTVQNDLGKYQELAQELQRLFQLATAQKPLVLLLDGLDLFSDISYAMRWLPLKLPEHVQLLVTVKSGECLRFLKRKLPSSHILYLHPMSYPEGEVMLDHWLANENRHLTDDQRSYILTKFASTGLPLYLELAFLETHHWHSYDSIPDYMSENISDMLRDLVNRLAMEENHGRVLVLHALGYLAAAKNGLSEDEILDVLSMDTEVMADFRQRFSFAPKVDGLPEILWKKLYYDLRPYLQHGYKYGDVRLTLRHRQMVETIGEEEVLSFHRRLASYFDAQLICEGKEGQDPNSRKISELTYQQQKGKLWNDLYRTLSNLDYIQALFTVRLHSDVLTEIDGLFQTDINDLPNLENIKSLVRFLQNHAHILRAYPNLVFQQALNEPVVSVAFQIADKQREDFTDPWIEWLNKPQCADPCTMTLVGHTGLVQACAWSPDSRLIVSCSSDKRLTIWSVPTGFEEFSLIGHVKGINACDWSSSKDCIVSSSDDKTLKVWDSETGEERYTLSGHIAVVRACKWSPDARFILSGSDDGVLKIWNSETRENVISIAAHNARINGCTWSPDGSHIASASDDTTIKIWETKTGQHVKTLIGHLHYVSSCAWSPDGKMIVSSSWDNNVKIWDLETGRELATLIGHKEAVKSCSWSSDGRYILSCSSDRTLIVWDLASHKIIVVYQGHSGFVNECAWSPDMNYIVSASCDGSLKVWQPQNNIDTSVLSRHTDMVRDLSVSPDGLHFVSGSSDKTLKLWDSTTGLEKALLSGHTDVISSCAWSPDGSRIASVSFDGTIKIWDPHVGREMASFSGHRLKVTHCSWSPDGQYLVTTSYDNTLKIWSSQTWLEHLSVDNSIALETCAWSPDGKYILYAGWDGEAKILELDKKGSYYLYKQPGVIKTCSWSPDGRHILTGSTDGTLVTWDMETNHEINRLNRHESEVLSCAWSSDGLKVISGSRDKRLVIGDAATGEISSQFIANGDVCAIANLLDGSKLVIGDNTGRIYLLQVNHSQPDTPVVTA